VLPTFKSRTVYKIIEYFEISITVKQLSFLTTLYILQLVEDVIIDHFSGPR